MDDTRNDSGSGRGWHGDSEEHARVGAMGGRANSQSSKNDQGFNKKGKKGGRAQEDSRELSDEEDLI